MSSKMFVDNTRLTSSQSILLKKAWLTMSKKPDSRWHPSLSPGFLFRNPFNTDAAFTDKDLGIRIVFSKMTVKMIICIKISKGSQ